MDIKKLQNGDFVMFNMADKIVKVTSIRLVSTHNICSRLDVIFNKYHTPHNLDHYDTNEYDEISPIDVTEKFLKDNKFILIEKDGGRIRFRRKTSIHKITIILYPNGNLHMFINKCEPNSDILSKDFRYIHELQQALRVMNVDLELTIKED